MVAWHGTRGQYLKHIYFNKIRPRKYSSDVIRLLSRKPFKRLIFACRGNVCRSPYAEYRARDLGFHAISCGIDTTAGKPATDAAQFEAGRRGIDLSAHRTTRIQSIEFRDDDLLLAMEPWHMDRIRSLDIEIPGGTVLLGQVDPRDPIRYIPDPYGLAPELFQYCFDRIDAAILALHQDPAPRVAGKSQG